MAVHHDGSFLDPPPLRAPREEQLTRTHEQSMAVSLRRIADALDRHQPNVRTIVTEEWHRAVREFKLKPGSQVETVVSRIMERLNA